MYETNFVHYIAEIYRLFVGFVGCCFLRYQTREAALNAQKALNNIRIMPGVR